MKAKKVVMPKIKSSYEKAKKQVVSGVKKLQPQLKKAKKEMMPKIKSLYGKARKKVKSGMMKVQPQLKKAKKFVEEKTPKEAKKHAFRAYIFLRAAREDLVKILAARLLTMYENVEFFAPYATKSYAMFFRARPRANVDVLLSVPNVVANAFRTKKSKSKRQ